MRERLNRNSTNSNQPPSQDSPFQPPPKEQKQAGSASKEKASKESAPSAPKKPRPYHKGASQQILTADETLSCAIGPCSCGCHEYKKARKLGVHQWLELRERPWYVVHILLEEVECVRCGKTRKGHVPAGYETGYGPGLTACIATLNAGATVSWRKIADFFQQIFGIPISLGAIGKCLKRAAKAIEPHYEAIGRAVRAAPVNHVDETSWRQIGPSGKKLLWLWVLTGSVHS